MGGRVEALGHLVSRREKGLLPCPDPDLCPFTRRTPKAALGRPRPRPLAISCCLWDAAAVLGWLCFKCPETEGLDHLTVTISVALGWAAQGQTEVRG